MMRENIPRQKCMLALALVIVVLAVVTVTWGHRKSAQLTTQQQIQISQMQNSR